MSKNQKPTPIDPRLSPLLQLLATSRTMRILIALLPLFIIAQFVFDLFAFDRLQHQEQMNREQVKFDTTIAQKVFGYDARYSTNVGKFKFDPAVQAK
jgi:hypothetical protein